MCGYYLSIRIYFPHCPPDSIGVTHPADDNVSVVALNEAGKVRVTWSRPALGPGQVITGYSVQYRRRGTTSYTTRSVSGSSTTSYIITNLNLGRVYEVRVASEGLLGLSGYCCYGIQVTTYNREWTAKFMQYKLTVYWLWLTTSQAKSKLITQILVYSLICIADYRCQYFLHELRYCNSVRIVWHTTWYPVQNSLFKLHHFLQMYLGLLLEVCQWWHWMNQARSESLGVNVHWDLVKWSLVTLCSTG